MSTDVNLEQAFRDPTNFDFESLLQEPADDGDEPAAGKQPAEATPAPAQAAAPATPSPAQTPDVNGGASATPATTVESNAAAPQPEGVLTRDGKHVVPYTVLSNERERAAAAERARLAAEQLADQEKRTRQEVENRMAQMQAQLDALNSRLTTAPAQQPAAVAAATLPAELRQQLSEEAPAVLQVFDAMAAELSQARNEARQAATEAQTVRRTVEQERAAVQQQSAEEAVSNNAKLVYLRSTNPSAFNAIVDIDDFNLTQPWARQVSIGERLAKSVAMYEAANGPVELPAAPSAAAAPTTDPKVAAQAAIARAQATQAAAAPATLSDLPGGALPPKSGAEALAQLSPDQLAQRFMSMDPNAVDAMLAQIT